MKVVQRVLELPSPLSTAFERRARQFSVLQRPAPNYAGHVPLNAWEQGALAVGSAVLSLANPRRAGR